MIAGCISQAIKILEGFDEILDGPSPEELVESTHEDIGKLLESPEALELFGAPADQLADKQQKKDMFIKRVVEAVSPIVPVSIRNKSLDSTFFRTALHLLAASELMFTQYEADVRSQANPAGIVGLCNTMHAEIKRSAVHSLKLKSLKDFTKEMKSEYNTSLGLGEAFLNDITRRERRRGRGTRSTRGQPWRAANRVSERDSSRGQRGAQPYNPAVDVAEFGLGNRRQMNPTPFRGRGDCYAFLAGNCRRGNDCWFLHRNP